MRYFLCSMDITPYTPINALEPSEPANAVVYVKATTRGRARTLAGVYFKKQGHVEPDENPFKFVKVEEIYYNPGDEDFDDTTDIIPILE